MMLLEAAKPMLVTVASLQAELLKGAICATGCATPELAEVTPEVEVFAFELPNGSWVAQGVVHAFGYKIVCKRS